MRDSDGSINSDCVGCESQRLSRRRTDLCPKVDGVACAARYLRPLRVLSGHPKTGQRWSGQNRPTEEAGDSVVLPCSLLWRQVYFRTPTPGTAFEYMTMMKEAIEHGGDGGAISQQFAPVVYGSVRGEQSTGALIASHDDLQQFLGGGEGQLAHTQIINDEERNRSQ